MGKTASEEPAQAGGSPAPLGGTVSTAKPIVRLSQKKT